MPQNNQASIQDVCLDQLVPFFQPIMDLTNQTVWRYECLARMVTAEQRTFLPSQFLYLIERDGQINALSETMFSRSAEYFRHLNIRWNINLSSTDVKHPDLVTHIKNYLETYPNPSRVGIEITAQSAIEIATDSSSQFLLSCKSLKLRVFVDHLDEASLTGETLWQMPIDGIKVNAGLLLRLATQQKLEPIMGRLKGKHIHLIAEHVENQQELEQLKLLGINYAQGFHLSQPDAQVIAVER